MLDSCCFIKWWQWRNDALIKKESSNSKANYNTGYLNSNYFSTLIQNKMVDRFYLQHTKTVSV